MIALQSHGLNIVAMDGITVSNMYRLKVGAPVVMGAGQRVDVLVKAGNPELIFCRRWIRLIDNRFRPPGSRLNRGMRAIASTSLPHVALTPMQGTSALHLHR